MKRKSAHLTNQKHFPEILNSPTSKRVSRGSSVTNLIKISEQLSKTSSAKETPILTYKTKPNIRFSIDYNTFASFFSENSLKQSFLKDPACDFVQYGPAARKEVKELLEWLDSILKTLGNKKFDDPAELFEAINEIYTTCLSEVVRQVSVQCKERGFLLSRIWQAYQSLFEKALNIANSKILELKDSFSKEKLKIKQKFLTELSETKEKVQKTTQQRDELAEKLEKTESWILESKNKENKLMNYISLLKQRYKNAKKDIFHYREENRILKIKYESTEFDKIKPKKRRWGALKKYKKRDDQNLELKMTEDPVLKTLAYEEYENLVLNIYEYGKIYAEKGVNEMFCEFDYKDQGTDALKTVFKDFGIQTSVEDLCGETVTERKRILRNQFNTLGINKANRRLFDKDLLEKRENIEEIQAFNGYSKIGLKNNQFRLKDLLVSFKEVIKP